MLNLILWKLVIAVHILCFVTWIGGNIFICIALFPSLKLLDKTQRSSVLLQSLKRYFRGMSHAIIGLFVTGALLIYHIGSSALASRGIIGMLTIAVIIAILFCNVCLGDFKKAQRSIRPQDDIFLTIRKKLLLITLLGIIAIFCAIIL